MCKHLHFGIFILYQAAHSFSPRLSQPKHLGCDTLYPLYSLGLQPNCFLKLSEKCERFINPVISAISVILYFPLIKYSAALFNLYFLKREFGFVSVKSIIF